MTEHERREYSRGFRDGLGNYPMTPPEYRTKEYDAYMSGYRQGESVKIQQWMK